MRHLLAGTAAEQDEALVLIQCRLRRRLLGWLHDRFGYLDRDSIEYAWTDMLVAVLQLLRAGRYSAGRPLLPWLCHLLHRRMVDQLRGRQRRLNRLATYGAMKRCGRRRAALLAGAAEEREVVQLIAATIAAMPPQQQRVLQVFIEHYPESRRLETLTELVSQSSGRTETWPSVKHALQLGREKLRAALDRHGYRWPGLGEV